MSNFLDRSDLDEGQIEALREELQATSAQVNTALWRAIRRTARHYRAKAAREVRKELNVPAAVLKRRILVFLKKGEQRHRGRIFFGLDPISLGKLSPRQTRTGVTTKVGRYPGAFIAKGEVWKRRGPKRFPIDKQTFEIAEKGPQKDLWLWILDELFADIDDIFYRYFEHELRWATRADNPGNA